MTKEEAVVKLKAKLECMTRDVSGTNIDCNKCRCDECKFHYAQGNMGEQIECLRISIETLQNQIPRKMVYESDGYAEGYHVWDVASCPGCGRLFDEKDDDWQTARFCPFCGQALDWEMEALHDVPDVNVGEMEVEDEEGYND